VRWYEILRVDGAYSGHQQGTFAPADGVHRWMGSAAMDRLGNIALAYSVVNGLDVFPGIPFTGRLAGDPSGVMSLGEAVIVNGSGVQTTMNSRWGDYTSLNVDPSDDLVRQRVLHGGWSSFQRGRLADADREFPLTGCASSM
jgi:hypothetical protein